MYIVCSCATSQPAAAPQEDKEEEEDDFDIQLLLEEVHQLAPKLTPQRHQFSQELKDKLAWLGERMGFRKAAKLITSKYPHLPSVTYTHLSRWNRQLVDSINNGSEAGRRGRPVNPEFERAV